MEILTLNGDEVYQASVHIFAEKSKESQDRFLKISKASKKSTRSFEFATKIQRTIKTANLVAIGLSIPITWPMSVHFW